MKRWLKLMSVVIAIIFILASCGGGGGGKTDADSAKAASEAWAKENKLDVGNQTVDELYELAKEEGMVSIYSISSRTSSVKESFEKQYPGVTVDVYDISTNELIEKVTREYDAGIRTADLIHIKDMDGSIHKEKVLTGIFHNYYPDDITEHIDDKYLTNAMPLYIELSQWFFNYEANDTAPVTSWWDLTKPEWKGKMLITNPMDNNNYMAAFVHFVKHADDFEKEYEEVFGEPIVLSDNAPTAAHELMIRLVANDLIFTSSSDEITESVGTPGQANPPLGYAASSKIRKNESDGWVLEPINISPATGVVNQNNLYILNEAPHPNAAKLLLRWMVGEADGTGEGFDPFNTQGGWSVRDDVPLHEGNMPLEEILVYQLDPDYVYDNMQEVTDFWISIQN